MLKPGQPKHHGRPQDISLWLQAGDAAGFWRHLSHGPDSFQGEYMLLQDSRWFPAVEVQHLPHGQEEHASRLFNSAALHFIADELQDVVKRGCCEELASRQS